MTGAPHGPVQGTTVTGLCVDGPMAGAEVPVLIDADGEPAAVIDVDGRAYVLAVQAPPVIGRPWRYTVARNGHLYVIDGGEPPR